MPWWLYGIVANVCIMMVEYINRTGNHGSFIATIPYTCVFIIISQWGLYASWVSAPSMMLAWITFTIGNTVFRIFSNQFLVHEPINAYQIAGIGVMLCGAYVFNMMGR